MANYRVNAKAVEGMEPVPLFETTGEAADGKTIFTEWKTAKNHALGLLDSQAARLKARRRAVRSFQEHDAPKAKE
jgi:hypothetical protein